MTSLERTRSVKDELATIGLLDGSTRIGRLQLQSFEAPTQELRVTGGLGQPVDSVIRIAAETVAYIAFHRAPGARPVPAPPPRGQRLRVHVAGRVSFAVIASDESPSDAPGYFATSTDPESEFSHFFFFERGVIRREVDVPMGAFLVNRGVLSSKGLEQSLAAQNATRAVPLGKVLAQQKKIASQDLEQAVQQQQRKRMRLGEILLELKLIDPRDLELALLEQRQRRGKRLGEIIVSLGLITEIDLAQTLARKFNMPFLDLSHHEVDSSVVAMLPQKLMERLSFLPLSVDAGILTIAIADPLDTEIADVLRFETGLRVSEVVVVASQLQALRKGLAPEIPSVDPLTEVLMDDTSSSSEIDRNDDGEATPASVGIEDNTVVRLANHIISEALSRGASDIHVEPRSKGQPVAIRFRVDGDLVPYQDIPARYRLPLVARLKILSSLDIAERRKPQDGKIKFRGPEKEIELRIATLPTVNGSEDVVMRVLASSKPQPLAELGLSERNLKSLQTLIERPHGLALVVGPTGSGKTTTLHSVLGAINTDDRKIWTAEDPVEITQPGLRQVQVNTKIGLTFASAMRAFLRADPDVIMVGEMRDAETAGMAVEASLTGHLVFSTLHTNSASESVTRLLDMGLDPFSFSDSLLGIVAQRLARSLCSQCKEPYEASAAEADALRAAYGGELPVGKVVLHRSKGCAQCNGTGLRGRLGLHEVLVASEPLKAAMQRRAPAAELLALGRKNGLVTLVQDGVEKVLQGQTTLPQVLAVTGR